MNIVISTVPGYMTPRFVQFNLQIQAWRPVVFVGSPAGFENTVFDPMTPGFNSNAGVLNKVKWTFVQVVFDSITDIADFVF